MAQELTTRKTGSSRNGKAAKTAPRKSKKTKKTADELMLEAWKYTYETRHKRLLKP
ncbi:MAG: hypothetical protein ACJ74J_12080 [Blastocatellia bacterium]